MARMSQRPQTAQATTFMGLPVWDGGPARAVLLGAGCATIYPSAGAYCAAAPAAIRGAAAPLAASISHVNFDLMRPTFARGGAADAGDLALDPQMPAANRAAIEARVRQIIAVGAVPVLLGGDDSVPGPMIAALGGTGQRYTILQIDAHIDWRDEVEGERWGLSSTMRRASEMGHVERIIQVGARGTGSARPSDLDDARAWGAQFITARQLAEQGSGPVIDLIAEGAQVIVTFDCDALDPSVMPAVLGRTAGGLSYGQVLGLIEAVAARGRIAAFDMVEFMPEADMDGLGAMLAAQLLAASMGIIAHQG